MNFASVRIITDDVDRLVEFYEKVMGYRRSDPRPYLPNSPCHHAPLQSATPRRRAIRRRFRSGANNRTIIIEFRVDDVEAEYVRLKPFVDHWVKEPTMMPWGTVLCCSAIPMATFLTSLSR